MRLSLVNATLKKVGEEGFLGTYDSFRKWEGEIKEDLM